MAIVFDREACIRIAAEQSGSGPNVSPSDVAEAHALIDVFERECRSGLDAAIASGVRQFRQCIAVHETSALEHDPVVSARLEFLWRVVSCCVDDLNDLFWKEWHDRECRQQQAAAPAFRRSIPWWKTWKRQ